MEADMKNGMMTGMDERLTFEGNFCDIALCLEQPGGVYCKNNPCSQYLVWQRLKQYEDTGLSPQEVAELAKRRR